MNMYVLFPTLGDRVLAEKIYNRLLQLGYKEAATLENGIRCGFAISIDRIDRGIKYTPDAANIVKHNGDQYHTLGNLTDLFFTEKYKFIEPKVAVEVKLNSEYTAKVTDKEIVVGCQKFSADKVVELAKAIETYKNQ